MTGAKVGVSLRAVDCTALAVPWQVIWGQNNVGLECSRGFCNLCHLEVTHQGCFHGHHAGATFMGWLAMEWAGGSGAHCGGRPTVVQTLLLSIPSRWILGVGT